MITSAEKKLLVKRVLITSCHNVPSNDYGSGNDDALIVAHNDLKEALTDSASRYFQPRKLMGRRVRK